MAAVHCSSCMLRAAGLTVHAVSCGAALGA